MSFNVDPEEVRRSLADIGVGEDEIDNYLHMILETPELLPYQLLALVDELEKDLIDHDVPVDLAHPTLVNMRAASMCLNDHAKMMMYLTSATVGMTVCMAWIMEHDSA